MKISRSWRFPMIVPVAILLLGGRATAEDAPIVSKDNGPFMVLAYSFRGPDAEARAQALATELRDDQGVAAYICPQPVGRIGQIHEVVVLVGDAKTTAEAYKILRRVREIKPTSLAGMPYHKDLKRAIMTTNPFLPPERVRALFPEAR